MLTSSPILKCPGTRRAGGPKWLPLHLMGAISASRISSEEEEDSSPSLRCSPHNGFPLLCTSLFLWSIRCPGPVCPSPTLFCHPYDLPRTAKCRSIICWFNLALVKHPPLSTEGTINMHYSHLQP